MLLHRPTATYRGSDLAGVWHDELPGTGIEIVLELGGRWDVEIDGARSEAGAFVAGLVAGPVRTRAQGEVRLVQLSIQPLAVPALFGVPAGALSGAIVDTESLLGARGSELLESLDDAGELAGDAADAWARRSLAGAAAERAPLVPADVRRAVGLLRASGGAIRIAALATELGCSRRHLARRFDEWVGVAPSEFARLLRFERATTALRAAPELPLGRVAIDSGYADHAHMVHEFRSLAGATPTAVADRFRPSPVPPS